MNDLKEELDFTLEILIKSAFYSEEEILNIIEEQFIEEDINFDNLDISLLDNDSYYFNKLKDAFFDLNQKNILSIHNCGYDLEEGLDDVFELCTHLNYNKLNPKGFCFYSFEDIEEVILEGSLFLTFSDFSDNKADALKIGEEIVNVLKEYDFNVNWDNSVDNIIEINPFIWDKSFYKVDNYEIEEVYELFKKLHS